MNVLIIDDSRTSRVFIADAVEKGGHSFYEAKDGIEGLEKIKDLKPHLIILDLLMPNMDGFEVLEILKNEKSEIPVMVISADIQDEVKKECIELGAKLFINKPFTPEDLISAINSLK